MRTDKDIKLIQKDGNNEKVLHPETNVSQIKDLLDGSGLIKSALLPSGGGSYTLPKATNTVRGGVKLTTTTTLTKTPETLSTTDNRTYQVQMNGSEQLVVNVPWVETYSKGEVDLLIEQELNDALGDIESALNAILGV